jgi:hypothetical protein
MPVPPTDEAWEAETAFLARALGLKPRGRRPANLPRVLLHACPRCEGDLMLEPEDWHSSHADDEFACLQCGRRVQVGALAALRSESLPPN